MLLTYFSFSQWDAKKYHHFWDKGDSLYNAKDYKNAALAYSSANVISDGNVSPWERWITARSWSMANYPDSAFYHLSLISNSKKITFFELNDILADEDLIPLHQDKRWQDIKGNMLSNAKKIFFSSQQNTGGKITISDRFEAACAWALMNNPDSAFAQLNIIAITKDNTFSRNNSFQTETILFSLHQDSRWKQVVKDIYTNIAESYSSRIRSGRWTDPTLDGYDAACSWALADEPDSAFLYLKAIVNTKYNVFTAYPLITTDIGFISLHSDRRWQAIIDTVKKNYTPVSCGHSPTGPWVPMVFTVDTASSFLKSDGLGSYKNGVDKVSSAEVFAYHLRVSSYNIPFIASKDKTDLSTRSLILDLNSPVISSGSKAQGVIQEHDAAFTVFYKFDTTVTPKLIYNFREIPVGATIESSRTEIIFYINGELHTLILGSWGTGDCNEPYSHGGRINGVGTTRVRVTRHTVTSYTVEADDGSIGRLWNKKNMTSPVDMGLFKTGFIIHLQYQK